jgi:hypothetical protein
MLGCARVGPKHVLLALTRHGNVESLLAQRGITGSDVYSALVRADGIGDEFVSGSLPRSASVEEAMRPPMSSEQVYSYALHATGRRTPPRPGPGAPRDTQPWQRARRAWPLQGECFRVDCDCAGCPG